MTAWWPIQCICMACLCNWKMASLHRTCQTTHNNRTIKQDSDRHVDCGWVGEWAIHCHLLYQCRHDEQADRGKCWWHKTPIKKRTCSSLLGEKSHIIKPTPEMKRHVPYCWWVEWCAAWVSWLMHMKIIITTDEQSVMQMDASSAIQHEQHQIVLQG